jgi:glycosyltransferase involved in cell wall biosynthesis
MNKKLTVVTTTYRAEKYLDRYFRGILSLPGLEDIKFIIVMNEPRDIEREIGGGYGAKYSELFSIIEIDKKETIGASLNRGFRLANTRYISLLDVDDLREEDSFTRQMTTLDDNPDVDYTYGDFMVVREQGEKDGKYVSTMEFDKHEFTRGCHASPAHLFRRTLLDKIGGFDEQLRSGGDFDFQIRAAFNCNFKKTDGLLYYYTHESSSGSASSNILQPIERTVIELRYGLYDITDKLNGYPYISRAKKYRLDQIMVNGKWYPLEQYIPNYRQILSEKQELKKTLERRYPFKITKHYLCKPFEVLETKSKGTVRMLLAQLGLLERLRALRTKRRRNIKVY